MPVPNRSNKQRSRLNYNSLEPRRLLASVSDLIVPALPESNYLLEDSQQEVAARENWRI